MTTDIEDAGAVAPASSNKYRRARWMAVAYSVIGMVSFLLAWQLASQFTRTEFDLLSSPTEVAQRMVEFTTGNEEELIPPGWVVTNFWDTFRKTLYGFLGALALGTPIGVLMGRYRYAKNFFFDFVYLAANVPLIVYAILGLLIFGIGDAGPAFVVGLLVLPIITLNVAEGVESVDQRLLTMSRAFNLPSQVALRHIVMPSVSPFLFAAVRASFSSSWKLAALAETFGGTTGVGVQIRRAFQEFSITDMLAWMMFFVVFVIVVERLILMRLERWVFRYRLKRGQDLLRF